MMNTEPDLNVSDLKPVMARPPFITAGLPGTGGVIKAVAEHFQVQEVLPYAPCGEGEHVFVTVKRAGWNTPDVAEALGQACGVKGPDIGWGGRKDKHAVATQTFSLRMPMQIPLARIEAQLKSLPFDIIAMARHGNKLKTGHVAANKFRIILSQVDPGPDAFALAQAVAAAVKLSGVPNYYGEQRFGSAFRNLDRAGALIKRGKAHGKKDTFIVSALQSALFNCWLIERIERGQFGTLITGDVARKSDSGGLFIVEDPDREAKRFEARAISYTGPIFGHKMMAAAGQAAEYEHRVLTRLGLSPQIFKPLRAPGSRRPAVLNLDDLDLAVVPEGLSFSFTLPAGAYATTVLREFTKSTEPAVPLNE